MAPGKPPHDTEEAALAARIAFLCDPAHYPDRPARVELQETHLSWVFLAGDRVYKLKKPLLLPHLDFRGSDARRRNAEREVALNRRLAPEVYLGTLDLTREPDGSLALAGSGEAVDTLVAMRRLPSEASLDRVIAAGRLQAAAFAPAAARIVRFLCEASPVPQRPKAYRARLARMQADSAQALERPDCPLTPAALERLSLLQLRALAAQDAHLAERARRVVEGHGDLRPEHVYLIRPPTVIDCLEFDRGLRLLDPLEELAFLGMECEALGERRVLAQLLRIYGAATGERPKPSLLALYRSLRASLRARLALQHLDEPRPRRPEFWPRQAAGYLELAVAAAEESLDGS